ncbi:hypothetical protein ACFY5D_16605 [Paeniglutamicibacter sp. NPDC012692]|uniref:hypothetical protein n=1 Tax=Paeniglutamicibacter sp. NPDC012692 TaxID=3364388 RepID=UPI0036922534
MSKSLDQISKQIKKLLKAERDSSGMPSVDNLKAIAKLIVEARQDHFTNKVGDPDLKGQSWAYRQWAKEAFLDGEDSSLAARVRFHTGNALREIVPAEQLKEAGLLPSSPKERSKKVNNSIANLNHIINGGGKLSPDELPQALEILAKLSKRIPDKNRDDLKAIFK